MADRRGQAGVSEPARDRLPVSSRRRVLPAAAGAVLLASVATAQPAGSRPPEAAPAGDAGTLPVLGMTACLDALRQAGARTAVAGRVSCAVGTTTRVGYCQFWPAAGGRVPMLELFREPVTHPGRGDGAFAYDAGIAVAAPDAPAARVLHFFARGRAVATMRLDLASLSSSFEPPPREAPASVAALLRDGDAVREACFGLQPIS